MTNTPSGCDQTPAPTGPWHPLGPHPATHVTVTRHHPEQQQPFGVIEQHPDGHMSVHVADHWPYEDPAEAMGLATLLRPAKVVEIVGTGRVSIKPAKAALTACWQEQDRTVQRAEAAADGLVPDERVLCGEPTATGTRCRQRAGWGTDEPHLPGPCSLHGGTRLWKTRRERELHERVRLVADLSRKASESGLPLSLEERLAGALALREVATSLQKARRRRRRTSEDWETSEDC